MYVCLCNGITSRQIQQAAETHGSTGGIYRSFGVQPRCGKCIPTIRAMISGSRQSQSAAPSPTADCALPG